MSKRYGEPIDVEAPEGSVEAFWWRGKRYSVREVLCRWRETGDWWVDAATSLEKGSLEKGTGKPWQAGDSLEIVRIEATAFTNGLRSGVYEIARDLRAGTWLLYRIWD